MAGQTGSTNCWDALVAWSGPGGLEWPWWPGVALVGWSGPGGHLLQQGGIAMDLKCLVYIMHNYQPLRVGVD